MSEDGEALYRIVDLNTGEEKTSSREFTGKGRAYYANGDVYEGDFRDGVRSGQGIYFYKRKHKYEGSWVDNLKNGIGKMTFYKKGVYFGDFQHGRRHGEGVFTYTNGDIYSGKWRHGIKHGKGTYIYKENGMKIDGFWGAGTCTAGKWILPNGVFFEGSFANNKPNGNGVWHFPNGNTCAGVFTQKEKEDEDEEEVEEEKPENSDPEEDEEEIEPEEDEEEAENEEEKKRYELIWHSNLSLAESARLVKEIPALD